MAKKRRKHRLKFRKHPYVAKKYTQDLIDKYKSPDNMLRHARCEDGDRGYFYVNQDTDELVGYIGWKDNMIIALEVVPEYEGKGYAKKLLRLANSVGVNRLTVNKSNKHAIDIYRHLGWKQYKDEGKMLFFEKKLDDNHEKRK